MKRKFRRCDETGSMGLDMRNAALVASLLVLSGCSGVGKWLSDTATLPGENPNMPGGDSENMRRVRGYATAETPILPQPGNIWPGPPAPLPSLSDVGKDSDGSNPDAALQHRLPPQLPDGADLSIGDDKEPSDANGFSGRGLPSSEPDAAAKYGFTRPNANIEIPNNDGTITVIRPDGSVSTRKATAADARKQRPAAPNSAPSAAPTVMPGTIPGATEPNQ